MYQVMLEAGSVAFLNDDTSQPTHVRSGRLALTFLSALPLRCPFTSPSFVTIMGSLFIWTLSLPPPPLPPRYSVRLADWAAFHRLSENLVALTHPRAFHHHEARIVWTLHRAVGSPIPRSRLPVYHHRGRWIYGARVRELNHRLMPPGNSTGASPLCNTANSSKLLFVTPPKRRTGSAMKNGWSGA